MLYTVGDTHGNQYKWVEQIEPILSPSDIILICGDFGVGFWNGRYWSEETFYDFLSEQEYTVLFIDGNHENFDKLNSYPVETWCGGNVHKIRNNNVIHLVKFTVLMAIPSLLWAEDIPLISIAGQKVFRGGHRKCPLRKNTSVPLRISIRSVTMSIISSPILHHLKPFITSRLCEA